MSLENVLVINFNYLKEKVSLSELGVKNSTLFICKIPYFNKHYYLIRNSKKEYIKIKFEDNTEIEVNAKIFISELEPINIKVLSDSSYQGLHDIDNSPVTLKTFKDYEKRYRDYPLKFVNQKLVDNYFINDYMIKEEEVENYLFKIPVPDKLLKFIKVLPISNKLNVSFDSYSRTLPSSILKENFIYTNSHTDCLLALNKLDNLVKGIPNLTIYQLKKRLHSKVNLLEIHVNYTIKEADLIKFESKLDELIDNFTNQRYKNEYENHSSSF